MHVYISNSKSGNPCPNRNFGKERRFIQVEKEFSLRKRRIRDWKGGKQRTKLRCDPHRDIFFLQFVASICRELRMGSLGGYLNEIKVNNELQELDCRLKRKWIGKFSMQ